MLLLATNVVLLLVIFFLFFRLRNAKTLHQESNDDLIWNAILQLSNPEVLHSDWHSCLHEVHPDICKALEADELFLLDKTPPGGTPRLKQTKDDKSARNHNWILSVPPWIEILEKGQYVHNISKNFDASEQTIMEQEGIKTLLLIPLMVNAKLHGLLGIGKHETSTLFSLKQIDQLSFIANILAMTISNQQDRAERDRLATVVEQSSDGIIITSTSGSILYANPACETITGFSPEEITGKSIKVLHTPAIRKELWQQIKTGIKKGNGWIGQFLNRRKDGTLYQEEIQISQVYAPDGKVANQVLVKRDITEEKRLESIAEAANLMDNIGFIFSSIRHELGNPINSIKVSLSVLESNLNTYNKEDIKQFTSRSLSDIGRVEFLLNTLKNFSVFERPDIRKTDMQALLHKLTQLTEKDLIGRDIKLAIKLPKHPLTGMLDPRAFLQVLLNLITNAIAALEDTDKKTIRISVTKKQKHQIIFTLEDNGCGMEEETVRNLFRPFFTTKINGTGLGLVIVQKMLSKMNCSITATSRQGKGSRMEIIIPAA